jgi:hypothetical protein
MDTVTTLIMNALQTHIVGGVKLSHVVVMLMGSLIPVLVGIALPRKQTVGYGISINKFLGLFLLQKRIFGGANIPANILQAITTAIQTTFQDVSFGVYIDSRKDITEEERKQRIEDYLAGIKSVTTPAPVAETKVE